MLKDKKIILLLPLLLLIGLYFYTKNKNVENVSNIFDTNNASSTSDIKVANTNTFPKFFMGEVVSVGSDKVLIRHGSGDKSIAITKDTTLIQQVKENGAFKNIPALVTDIKAKQRIVVFYQEKSPNIFTADKIQILNF